MIVRCTVNSTSLVCWEREGGVWIFKAGRVSSLVPLTAPTMPLSHTDFISRSIRTRLGTVTLTRACIQHWVFLWTNVCTCLLYAQSLSLIVCALRTHTTDLWRTVYTQMHPLHAQVASRFKMFFNVALCVRTPPLFTTNSVHTNALASCQDGERVQSWSLLFCLRTPTIHDEQTTRTQSVPSWL